MVHIQILQVGRHYPVEDLIPRVQRVEAPRLRTYGLEQLLARVQPPHRVLLVGKQFVQLLFVTVRDVGEKSYFEPSSSNDV